MKRIEQIDGLRAIAVVTVVAFHCWASYFPGGAIGVDLFFVISGFVITGGMLNELGKTGAISIRNFYIRRVLRILPALFVLCMAVIAFLAVLTVFDPVAGGAKKFGLVALTLASVMNWARAFEITGGGMLGHTWSLSVEEQFYLVWPVVLVSSLKAGVTRSRLLSAVLVAIGAVVLWRAALFHSGASMPRITNGTDTRIDEILVGCALALAPSLKQRWISQFWAVPFLVFGVFIFIDRETGSAAFQIGYIVVLAASAWMLVIARNEDVPALQVLASKPFLWVGERSYSMYLWHYVFIYGLMMLGHKDVFWGAVSFVASFFAADLSYRYVELPFKALKGRFIKKEQTALT